jgi:hypothetical protein
MFPVRPRLLLFRLSSFSHDPGSGLAGILAHVDSLEMPIEHGPQKLFMLQRIPPKSELRGGTRRAIPRENIVVR